MPTKAQHSRYYKAFQKQLCTMRDEAGLTQRQLADLLGKPQSWVHNSETGNRRVDVAEFAFWAQACGVKPSAAVDRVLKQLGRSK